MNNLNVLVWAEILINLNGKWSLMLVVRDKFIVFSYVCVNKIKTWLLNCIRCLKYLCLSLKWTYQGSGSIWSYIILRSARNGSIFLTYCQCWENADLNVEPCKHYNPNG